MFAIYPSNLMKRNKKKFTDGIHAFYEVIAILATMDIME